MSRSSRRFRPARLGAVAALGLAVLLLPGVASASDLFFNATLGLKMGDDARFFLNLTNQHYAVPEPTAVAIVNRCPRPQDDFPVVMLLAQVTGRDANSILALRLRGTAWADIFYRYHVSPDVLFVGMDRDPGPPYGNAWGYWRKHRGEHKDRMMLPDDQIVELTKLQIASSYYRVSPYSVIGERQRGSTVEHYAVVHGRPSGLVPARKGGQAGGPRPERGQGHQDHDQDAPPGQGHGHGHGQGHDKEHGSEHD
jgi:hypothetical protein